jgi:thiamine-phosphate pyrophosphorylase
VSEPLRIQIADREPFSPNADFIQVRDHHASARELVRLTLAAMKTGMVLVNDRADVAVACGAAGVHLRSHAIAPSWIKERWPLIVSVACHSAEDVERAEEEGADYAILAPVFAPLSKQDGRQPLGVETLRRICAARKIPVIALGGITEANSRDCIAAGAAGIAGISLFRL